MIDDTLTSVEKEDQSKSSKDIFDTVIIGAGPAGMSAAICAARASLNVLLIDKALPGGECATACRIDNYIGHPGGVLGPDLGKKMEDQLKEYSNITLRCEVVKDILNIESDIKIVQTELENSYKTKTIILTIGLEPKKLNAAFESQFIGRGVSYFAQCDAEFHRDQDVIVIGGGNCACYAADYLANFASQVYMVHSFDHLRAVQTLKDKIMANPQITLMWDSQVTEVFGVDRVEKAKVENLINGQYTWVDVKGVFVYVGRKPSTDKISIEIEVDEEGYIVSDECMRTNIKGVFAAGDIRSKQVRQIATAVSDGMI